MRLPFPFVILIVPFLFLIIPGCISQQENPSFSVSDSIEEPVFVSLDDAMAVLLSDDGMRLAREPHYSIHSIIGENVTKEGNAKTWIVAIKAKTPFYFVFTANGFFKMNWTEESADSAIDFNKILSPSELFQVNSQKIHTLFTEKESGIHELELANGKYTIRGFHNGVEWQYAFDAVTGREIL